MCFNYIVNYKTKEVFNIINKYQVSFYFLIFALWIVSIVIFSIIIYVYYP